MRKHWLDTVVMAIAILPACACGGITAAQTRSPAARTSPFSVAAVDEILIATTIYVDQGANSASPSQTIRSQPTFRTVSAAVQFANILTHRGIGTKVVIRPGTYREQVSLSDAGISPSAPLVIEGSGAAVISGADVWTGWQQQGSAGTWVHAWPYQWGNAPYPPGWEGNVVLDPIVTRREMVIVNGKVLRQVLSPQQLAAGTYVVSETSQTVTVMVSPEMDLTTSTVEVAVRSPLFQVQGKKNIVLRGLTFQYANTALPDGAVQIIDSTGVLVENCNFVWNNWDGLDVLTSQNVTIRGVSADNNGGSGMGGYQLLRFLLSASGTSWNNWRGASGDFTGWAVAGAKFGRVHNAIVRRYTSSNNQARGLWLDFDSQNVTIDSSRFDGNLRDAIFLEANQGPLAITGSHICGTTSGAGIAGANTSDVTLTTNEICGNSPAQLLITGDADRSVTNWETGSQFDVRAERWTVCGNTTMSSNQLAVSAPNWPWFFDSLASDWNMWSSSAVSPAFVMGGQSRGIASWRSATHQDLHSLVSTGSASLPDAITDNISLLCSGIHNTQ